MINETCPRCGCQIRSPFGDGKLIHNVENCQPMIQATTQPTNEKVAREISPAEIEKEVFEMCVLIFGDVIAKRIITKGDIFHVTYWSIYSALAIRHLQQTAHLREQLQLKESQVGRCEELLLKLRPVLEASLVGTDEIEAIDSLIKDLPSTPNYVKRCEELEKFLAFVKENADCPTSTQNQKLAAMIQELEQQTLNKQV